MAANFLIVWLSLDDVIFSQFSILMIGIQDKYFHMFLVYALWTLAAVSDFQFIDVIYFRGWNDFSFPLLLAWVFRVYVYFMYALGSSLLFKNIF